MNFILIILACSVIIVGIELLKRRFSLSTNITRRATHIGTSLVVVIMPLFISANQIIMIGLAFAVVLFVGRRYDLFSAIHGVERRTFGEVYLPLGVAITAYYFLPNNLASFQFGVFIMGISDALGGLIGEQFGKHYIHFFGNKKSLEGSIIFFVSSLVITFLFFPIFGYQLVIVPLILTLTEFSLVYGLDNLILPVLGAFLAKGLF